MQKPIYSECLPPLIAPYLLGLQHGFFYFDRDPVSVLPRCGQLVVHNSNLLFAGDKPLNVQQLR